MNEEILNKLRKLLAVAGDDRNDSANEREIAMRHAHALLAKHGLTMSDVENELEVKETFGRLGRALYDMQTGRPWEQIVWDQIAKLNGCKCVVGRKTENGRKIHIIGRELRAEVIKQMAHYVIASIRFEQVYNGYSISFCMGAADGVASQVKKILTNMEAGEIDGERMSESTALMVVNQHKNALIEADRIKDQLFPYLRKGTAGRASNAGDYFAGKDYGSKIGLNQQVTHKRQTAGLLK